MPNIVDPQQQSFPAWQARRLGARVAQYLSPPGRDAEAEASRRLREVASRRLRAELQLLNDLEGKLHLFEQQLYAAELHLSSLYSDESAAKAPVGRKPDIAQIQKIEQQIAEAKDEVARLRPRRGSRRAPRGAAG